MEGHLDLPLQPPTVPPFSQRLILFSDQIMDIPYQIALRYLIFFPCQIFCQIRFMKKNYQIASRYPIFFPCQIFCQIRFMEIFYQIASWYPIFFPSQIRSWKFCIPLYDYPNKLATHHVDQHRNQLRAYNFDVQFVNRTIATKGMKEDPEFIPFVGR